MSNAFPSWIDPTPWLSLARTADARAVRRALTAEAPAETELAILLSPAADAFLEPMAQRAQQLTVQHFGQTISLYAPLYLSSYCSGGCVYCGFASDRELPRKRLSFKDVEREIQIMHHFGLEEVLLLTGERTPIADFSYLKQCISLAATQIHQVTIEVFPMAQEEYAEVARAGCVGVTIYQETYDPERYDRLHRWGPKKDYTARLNAPERALGGGLRFVGLGALLGLSDPQADMISLYRHVRYLQRRFWRGGFSLSFPRICPQAGGYQPEFPVSERELARIIFAFRICLPDVPLVLSTRERAAFRDGMAGVGVAKMSVASRTSVGGYEEEDATHSKDGQFDVNDTRTVTEFCRMLRDRGLEPVFKNWDAAYRQPAV